MARSQSLKTSPAAQADKYQSLGNKEARRYAFDSLKRGKGLFRSLTSTARFTVKSMDVPIQWDTGDKVVVDTPAKYTRMNRFEKLTERLETLLRIASGTRDQTEWVDTREKVEDDIDELQRYIDEKMEMVNNPSPEKHGALNEEALQECMNRVNNILRQISDTRRQDSLVSLDRERAVFHINQKEALGELRDKLKGVEVAMEGMMQIVAQGGESPLTARAAVPANTRPLRGRKEIVAELTAHLTAVSNGQRRRHICILGPGGIGKTSTALVLMTQPKVVKCYPGHNRVWVPCAEAISTSLLLDVLSSSLGMQGRTGSKKENVISTLRWAGPLVLLLDNLETLWNITSERSELEQLLMAIDEIPQVTLVVTMRSAVFPSNELNWNSVYLKAVDPKAAHQIYSNLHPKGSKDPQLPELLEVLGHMPLAITLMAKTAKTTKLSAKDVIAQYNETGTRMLNQGLDAQNSLDICITRSVESPLMKQDKEAQWLLGALAMLPTGATFEMLQTWWGHGVSIVKAVQTLTETSLVERQGSKPATFIILPVIRRYIMDPSRFNVDVQMSMVQSACDFMLAHRTSHAGDKMHKEYRAAIANQEENMEAILLSAASPSRKVVEALLVLAWYHHFTRPRTNAVELARKLVEQMDDNVKLHGDVLMCHGMISSEIGRLDESRKHYKEARKLFLSLSATREAAQCLLHCTNVEVLMESATPEDMKSAVARAESEFESVDDEDGIARCWITLSMIAGHSDDHHTALELLHRARDKYDQLGSSTASVHCLDSIVSHCYYLGAFEQAETCANTASQKYDVLGDSVGWMGTRWMLGRIYTALGKHRAALNELTPYLEWAKDSKTLFHIGRASEAMGVAWMQLGDVENARKAFQDALEAFRPSRKSGYYQCRYLLRRLDDPNAMSGPEEMAALLKGYPQKMLDLLGLF